MTPLLICSFKGRYLEVVFRWLLTERVPQKYRILVWDNGGAAEVCARYGVACYGLRDKGSGAAINLGKAAGMHYLVDIVNKELPQADCYVCMDDDVIVSRDHLDALAAAAQRPGMGMIGARFHPFNTTMPPGGQPALFDPCPACTGSTCPRCGGLGKDPQGLRLIVYPAEDRTMRNLGRIAGTLFAVSRAALARLPWAPYLYPIHGRPGDGKPYIYWTEDATLDMGLTRLGLTNGYLDNPDLLHAIHLPELNLEYMAWKIKARTGEGLATESPLG